MYSALDEAMESNGKQFDNCLSPRTAMMFAKYHAKEKARLEFARIFKERDGVDIGASGQTASPEVGDEEPGSEPTVRETASSDRQRLTISTSVQSASTASDALPPVGVLFKAAPTSQIPRALAAIMFADSCDNGVNKCHEGKGQKGEKSDKGKGKERSR